MDSTTTMVRRILRVYRSATPEQQREGMAWYDRAHSLALELDPHNVARAAGVIAAISPRMPWDRNVTVAVETYRQGAVPHFGLKGNAVKAQRILDGEHWADVLGGDKVRAFAATIIDPRDPHAVVVDRHAFDVAWGRVTDDATRNVLARKGAYDAIADAYRRAAKIMGVAPSQMQAVTWIVWRERKAPQAVAA